MTTPASISPELLAALGITREEILDRIAQGVLARFESDDNDEEFFESATTRFQQLVEARLRETYETKVREYFNAVAGPQLEAHIAQMTLQRTNEWGEKKGQAMTLAEWITDFGKTWLNEPVDFEGRTLEEARRHGGSFQKRGPRLAVAVDRHLVFYIESAAKQIIQNGSAELGQAITDAVRTALATQAARIKVTAEVPR